MYALPYVHITARLGRTMQAFTHKAFHRSPQTRFESIKYSYITLASFDLLLQL